MDAVQKHHQKFLALKCCQLLNAQPKEVKLQELHLLAKSLIEFETLTGDEMKKIISGAKIRMDEEKSNENHPSTSSVPNTEDNISSNTT